MVLGGYTQMHADFLLDFVIGYPKQIKKKQSFLENHQPHARLALVCRPDAIRRTQRRPSPESSFSFPRSDTSRRQSSSWKRQTQVYLTREIRNTIRQRLSGRGARRSNIVYKIERAFLYNLYPLLFRSVLQR